MGESLPPGRHAVGSTPPSPGAPPQTLDFMTKELDFNGKKITLLGTAHISEESVREVQNEIENRKPDCVCVELDEQRLKSLEDPESWKNMDIVKALKEKKGFLMLVNFVLSGFQKRMGGNVGIMPGFEMKAALEKCRELSIPAVMADRPIQTTLRRAWSKSSPYGKCQLLSSLIASAFSKEKISAEEVENLKNNSEMNSMMSELSKDFPSVKEVLIDERDLYLASKIWESDGNNVLAVIGAGHLSGVENCLAAFSKGEKSPDTVSISAVPEKSKAKKIAGWLISVLIIALIAAGFYFGGKEKGSDMLGSWIIWNSALAGLGALIAGGHIITILVSAIGAPLTSLCPLIGVGIVAGIVQGMVRKPKISDMENIAEDVTSVKGFYKNRILKVLLVFFLSSLGSSLGTFIAGANIIAIISEFFSKLAG